jgi:cytosine/adenosine deaminase-related metal-dependent hydrolase
MKIFSTKLITMQGAAPFNNGAAAVRSGTIFDVGPVRKIINKYPGHRVIHLGNSVLMPGLINLHAHLELPPLLDIIRANTFPDWVVNLIGKKQGLTYGDYSRAARQNIRTLLRTGTTTVADICTHNVSPAILQESGLRAFIFYEIISMNPSSFLPHLSSLITSPSSRLIQTGISPHAPYTVSEATLRVINQFSQKKDIRLAMHIAESKNEVRLLQRKRNGFDKLYRAAGWDISWAPNGSSPFEYLNRTGVLSSNLLAVHAVKVDDRDINLIKKSHAAIAHCPRSNRETGVGRMPLKKFLDAGVTVGLGTDSLASSPSLSMWDEMRYALRIHRRDGITAKDIFKLATTGGAKALGMESEIGSLESGKRADIIAVPLPSKNTGDLYSDLLRETKSCIMTMVDGKMLYSEGNNDETA